jgi:hypothetical protein
MSTTSQIFYSCAAFIAAFLIFLVPSNAVALGIAGTCVVAVFATFAMLRRGSVVGGGAPLSKIYIQRKWRDETEILCAVRSFVCSRKIILPVVLGAFWFIFYFCLSCHFKISAAGDFYFGADTTRVLGDFTDASFLHARVAVHPFYVLFWQGLFSAFRPFCRDTSDSIFLVQTIICFFSGLNVALLAIIFEKLADYTANWSVTVTTLLTACYALSFPNVLHGALMIESYVFTQFALLSTILYFVYAIPRRKFHFLTILFLSLFLFGNNIAYLTLLVILLFFLFIAQRNSIIEMFKKTILLASSALIITRIFLVIQNALYGATCPDNGLWLIYRITSGERHFILNAPFNLLNYTGNFFGLPFVDPSLLYATFPKILDYSWLFSFLLFIGAVGAVYKIFRLSRQSIYLPLALLLLVVFLFVFHSFYGAGELVLYSPVIISALFCVAPFALSNLTPKIKIGSLFVFLCVLFVVNSRGIWIVSTVDKFVFGETRYVALVSISPRDFVQMDIISQYLNGDRENSVFPEDILRRYAQRMTLGVGTRRKLCFENNCLYDVTTGRVERDFTGYDKLIFHGKRAIAIWSIRKMEWHLIREDENGVYLDDKLLAGTGVPIKISDFSRQKYPVLEKTRWFEDMIKGTP